MLYVSGVCTAPDVLPVTVSLVLNVPVLLMISRVLVAESQDLTSAVVLDGDGANVRVGTEVYPDPAFVIVTPVTSPLELTTAVPAAPVPPPPLNVTAGGDAERYPSPPSVIVSEAIVSPATGLGQAKRQVKDRVRVSRAEGVHRTQVRGTAGAVRRLGEAETVGRQ